MSAPSPRRRFLHWMLLVIALAAVAFAAARVFNTASQHDAPSEVASPAP